jgi:hypothetical protein
MRATTRQCGCNAGMEPLNRQLTLKIKQPVAETFLNSIFRFKNEEASFTF